MIDLDNPLPPVFTHAESIVGTGGLGLSKSNKYEDLVENYRQLFCRRCFTYDCKNHFIEQPMPRVFQGPAPIFPCPVPGLSLPTDPVSAHTKKLGRGSKRKPSNNQVVGNESITSFAHDVLPNSFDSTGL
jgi:hypothetical protein